MKYSLIYLDANATTPCDPRVVQQVQASLTATFGNPSSRDHPLGWDAADAVDEARRSVAELINAQPDEILFTSGATESINFALKGFFPCSAATRPHLLTQLTEHEAVLQTAAQLTRQQRAQCHSLPVDSNGRTGLDRWQEALACRPTALVCLGLANNETGVVHPVAELSSLAHRHDAVVFSDITQAAGKIPVDVHHLGIDLAAFSAHKMYGPKGVGALYVRSGEPQINLEPLISGGGQERGLRGGTLNVPGIVGFAEACRLARLQMHDESQRIGSLRDRLETSLLGQLSGIRVNGAAGERLPNTTNITFIGVDARTLIRELHDIAVSTRSACSSGQHGPSHVLKAMGLSDDEAYSSIRFSLGRFTTAEEIDYTIARVVASVRKLRPCLAPVP